MENLASKSINVVQNIEHLHILRTLIMVQSCLFKFSSHFTIFPCKFAIPRSSLEIHNVFVVAQQRDGWLSSNIKDIHTHRVTHFL